MPKHSPFGVGTKPVEVVEVDKPKEVAETKTAVEEVPTANYNTASSETVRLRIRVDANYKVVGRYSGQEYLFRGAGSEVDVEKNDVDYLLELRQGKGCCGGGGGNAIFELA